MRKITPKFNLFMIAGMIFLASIMTLTTQAQQCLQINCPPNQTVNAASGACTANVTVPTPVVTGCPSGNALALLGGSANDDYVAIGQVLSPGSSYTKEAWIKVSATLCENIMSSDGDVFWINNGKLSAGNASNYSAVADVNNIPLDTWVHVAVTYDAGNSTMRLFVNGTQVAVSNNIAPASGGNITIGQHPITTGSAGCNFKGTIDEARIWDIPRTGTQINALMNAEAIGSEAGLLALYNFNQGVADGNNTAIPFLVDSAPAGGSSNGSFVNVLLNGTQSNFVTGAPALNNAYTLTNSFNNTSNASGTYPSGTTTVTWTVTNAAGMSATCTQTITVISACSDLGDKVWNDLNGNGIQENGELGVPGVTVTLYKCLDNSQVGLPLVTNGNGEYLFENLPPGSYYVVFSSLPAGYFFSPDNQGSDDGLDSDADPITGKTGCVDLTSDNNNLTLDAGIYQKASFGNFVWDDLNGNGIQDPMEPGVPDVTVTLYRCSDNSAVGSPVTTDANGNYIFTGLIPGNYYAVFSNLPDGYTFSPNNAGSDDAIDNDADPSTGPTYGKTNCETLIAGENNTSYDAGIYETAGLGDFVWNDVNNNGIQDPNEPGVEGVIVTLYKCDNTQVGNPDVTDATGHYNFIDLVPGSYYVKFTLPSGYSFSPNNQGGDDAVDSDADPVTGKTICETLISGENNDTYDAGISQNANASIGNFVWKDLNANGIQDNGEPGVPGVTVTLYRCVGNTVVGVPVLTDQFGKYLFSNLLPGDYYVGFSNLPAGFFFSPKDLGGNDALDSDADPVTGKATCETLTSGENNTSYDAGIYQKASIGDKVWYDLNANGVQDADEAGVAGVTVTLYRCSDNTVVGVPAVTNANGNYLFAGLTPGDYYAGFSNLSAGYFFSPKDMGSNDALDSDADPVTGKATCETLTSGENNTSYDAGIYQKASIGDKVWYDLNGNGIQENGEQGVPGVTVTLYKCSNNSVVGVPVVTNANGNYLFAGLTPGDYYVGFSNLPAGYSFSPKDIGGNDAVDSDVNPATGKTGCEVLTSGENNTTYDAGLVKNASLGDKVWNDLNANGVQDNGEPGVPGVTVTLYRCSDNAVVGVPVVTDANGNYVFTDITPGSYYAGFSNLPSGFFFSPKDIGGNDAVDSDADPATGKTICETLIAGENNTTYDAGIYKKASIGNKVWNDVNKNGIQDNGEPGVPGVTVTLYKCSDNTVVGSPVLTDANGNYTFSNLAPGDYYVKFTLPSGYTFSPKDIGGNDALDSDADPVTGKAICETLTSGENNTTYDAGIYENTKASLGDKVWNDLNGNGIQDAGEPGVPGVTATLYRCSDNTVVGSPVITDMNGNYLFVNLVPGSYYVKFSNLPAGYLFSPKDMGGNDALDSDADPITGKTICETLTAGENNTTYDAGIYKNASIGDKVFKDLNANGVQDNGEPGVPGVTVTLYKCSDNTVVGSPVVTDANGNYTFSNLVPGGYYVKFTLPSGYTFSPNNTGGNDAIDSDADPVTGKTTCETLTSAETNTSYDAGIVQNNKASLGDKVWNDLNGNGIQDNGEPGVSGVTVTLYRCSDNAVVGSPDVTDINGKYLFTDLVPGSYYVKFTLPSGYAFSPKDLGGNDAADSDADPITGKTICETLAGGENNITYDAGIYQKACFGDKVWNDINNNGIQNNGEAGVSGVTVTLYRCSDNTVVGAPVVTDAYGKYLFSNLAPGNYYAGFSNLPAGYSFTKKDAAECSDALDSDADPVTGKTACVTLTSGECDLNNDAGLIKSGCIGDRVWKDVNNNGIQDNGEPGVSGITVTLYKCSDNTVAGSPVITNANGTYLFSGLNPGNYYIKFSNLPAGYSFTKKDVAGCNDALDSDVDPITGKTSCICLASGECNSTYDAGIYLNARACIGDMVWKDLNNNGIQDSGEPGVCGVTVTLFKCSDNTVAGSPVATDANGKYQFSNLVPGDYYLRFTNLPAGYSFTSKDMGGNDALDSDVDPNTGKTGCETLTSGECNSLYDAGISQILKASLGDRVWYDYNCNGIQNNGEPGVCGVTVTLFKCSDNTVVGTPKVTDSYGKYLFSNLVPGNYYVKFTNLPSGYSFSPKDVSGCNDALDSDADPYTGKTGCETLISGENNLTYDAGIIHSSRASLCDKVWYDNNKNGCQDNGEQGVPCVTVTLYRCSDNSIVCNPDVTDGNGKYNFSGLPSGNYYVKFSNLPSGYSFCPQNRGNDDEKDSDADPYTGKTGWYSLNSGQCRTSCDAGLISSAHSATNSNIVYTSEKQPVEGNVTIDESLVNVTAYPNPYTDRIVFTIKSSVSGNSSFDLFDLSGKKVATLFQGFMEKGTTKTIIYNVPGASRKSLIYRLSNGNELRTGKLIYSN